MPDQETPGAKKAAPKEAKPKSASSAKREEPATPKEINESAKAIQASMVRVNALAIKRGITDRPIITTIAEHSAQLGPPVATGISIIDALTGGGMPAGCSSLIWGSEGAGKTSFCLQCANAVLKADPNAYVLFVLAEAADLRYMAAIAGIDITNPRFLLLNAHGSGEHCFELMGEFLLQDNMPKNIVKLVVVDSLAGLEPKDIRNKIIKDGAEASGNIGRVAAMYSAFFRDINSTKAIGTGHLMLTSQVRVDIQAYGKEINVGGRAANHQVRFNLKLSRGENIYRSKEDEGKKQNAIGHFVEVNFVKDGFRGTLQNRKTRYGAIYGRGPDNAGSYVEMMLMGGGLTQPSSSYYATTEELHQFIEGPKDNYLKYNGIKRMRDAFLDPVLSAAAHKWLQWKMSTGGIYTVTGTADQDAMDHEDLGASIPTDSPTDGYDADLVAS